MNGCVSLFRAGDEPRLHREVPYLLFDDRSHVNDAGERVGLYGLAGHLSYCR